MKLPSLLFCLLLLQLLWGQSSLPDGNTNAPVAVVVPAGGKWINPDSVAKPTVVPAGNPAEISFPSNIRAAGQPRISPLLQTPRIIIPGKDGYSLPKATRANGKLIPTKQPKPRPVLPLDMKSDAIADFQILSVLQGMPSLYIGAMLEDHEGNLWFGTGGGGICRYDGHTMTNYSEYEGLAYSSIHAMLEDSHGNLWIGADRDHAMSKYDGHQFVQFGEEEGFSTQTILDILEDSKGNIWFGTSGGGAIRYEGKTFTHFTQKEGLSSDRILSILEDSRGNIWFGTNGGGACKFDGKGFTWYTREVGLIGNTVNTILEDSHGKLWFGTENDGITIFDGNRFAHYTIAEGLSSNSIKAIYEDKTGNIWIATFEGVIKFDGQNFTQYTKKEGLSSNRVSSIMEDSQGKLWFGTSGGGAIRYNSRSFVYYDHVGTPRFQNRKGNLFNSYNRGLKVLNYNRYSYTLQPLLDSRDPRSLEHIGPIIEDRKGNIWLGDRRAGLFKFDGQSVTMYTRKEGLIDNDISSLLEDSRGNIWIGTHSKGVSKFDGTAFTQFTEADGLVYYHVHAIMEDRKGNIWFGTDGGGVSKYDGKKFYNFTKKNGLNTDQVNTIFEDRKGNIWFGTWNGGLNIFDGKRFSYIKKEDGLSSNIIQTIIEDQKGFLWISTEQGLNLLVPDSSARKQFRIIRFGQSDGFRSVNVGGGFMDRSNRIWWGEAMLDLNHFELSKKPPLIRFNYLELEQTFVDFRRISNQNYRKTIAFGDYLDHTFDSVAAFYNYPLNLKLPYQISHLTFHFSAISWDAPHKILYQFKMDGLNEDWSPMTADNKADYRDLPPGTYTFSVRAASQSMVWSEPVTYRFTIHPPWWLSWWAYVFYIMAILGVLLGLRRYELNRHKAKTEARYFKELDSAKTKLYTNITHEFRTPLTVIMGMIDTLSGHEEVRRLVLRNSRQLLQLVNQMLDLAKLESGSMQLHNHQADIVRFLRYLTESFYSLAKERGIHLVFSSKEDELIMDFDEEKLQHIVYNLLSNALKFTPNSSGGTVKLMAQQIEKSGQIWLQIEVQDTGIGIPEEMLPHIFDRFFQTGNSQMYGREGTGIGLTLTKEFVELMGGGITVRSELGQGSTFIILLPVKNESSPAEAKPDDETVEVKLKPDLAVPTTATNRSTARLNKQLAGEKPLLLIVEDNKDVVTYIRTLLEKNYQIEIAPNGKAGQEMALELVPDIIISDVMMPEMDGFALTHTLKTDERTSHIPIILLTAKAEEQDRIAGLRHGADAYLIKPFNKTELLVRLEKLTELRRRLQQRYAGLEVSKTGKETFNPEDTFLQKLIQIVEEHLDDPGFSAAQLYLAAHMSQPQLYRKLMALTGKSPTLFIRTIRMRKALDLLQKTEMTISEIAWAVGFNDPSYFTRVFHEEFGKTPGEWRG